MMVRPRMDWLELDITYICGMNCHNCNRMTGIAPGRPEEKITVAQIETLITDSIRLQYPWQEWFLVGGEPTTHPDLDAIINRIAEYRAAHNPSLHLTLATHGHGDHTQRRLAELAAAFPFLQFLNSRKTNPIQPDFVAPCIAPVDLDPLCGRQHNGSYVVSRVMWRSAIHPQQFRFGGYAERHITARVTMTAGTP